MAKSFNFSLQKVLDVRRHKEEQKSIELHKAKQALAQEENKLMHLKTTKQTWLKKKEKRKKKKQQNKLQYLKITTDDIVQLNDRILNQSDRVQKSNEQVNTIHDLLMEAMKDKKIVEKLKERKQEAYKKEIMKQQSKIENEVAIRIAVRNKKEGKG